jgi:hypothetical protein
LNTGNFSLQAGVVTQQDASQNDYQQFSISTQDEQQSQSWDAPPSTIDASESQTEPDLNFQDEEELDNVPLHGCK